jgi:hypothetical protein
LTHKFSGFDNFPIFFFPFLLFLFSLSFFVLFHRRPRMHSSMKQEHLANSSGPSALLMRLAPWRPLVPSLQESSHPSPSLLLLPLHSLSGELPMVGNQALKSGNGRPLWKVSTKLNFLHGTTKTDAHDLPLPIRPQFYLKQTLISRFCGISFFKETQILSLTRILILLDSSHALI